MMNKLPKLNGLILAGGKSTRMQQDKSKLEYHGQPQVRFCYDLLSVFCENVFVSNRREQADLAEHKGLPQIHDNYDNIGPLGGILTAMQKYPRNAWLVLACDLPFVDKETIRHLISARDASKMATAYLSTQEPQLPEPLCAIYEPNFLTGLLENQRQKIYCPRKILINSEVRLIQQRDKNSLDNVNNPHEYAQAKKLMSGRQN